MTRLISLNLGNPEVRSSHVSNPSLKTLGIWGGGRSTPAGVVVNEKLALQYLTVFTCVKIIAETSAMLPLKVYERLKSGGQTPDPRHPLYRVLHDEFNPEMSAMTGRETMTGHLASWGNAYGFQERNNGGDVIAVWPLRPDRTEPVRSPSGRLGYETALPDGEKRYLTADQVLHLRGLSFDGLKGYSPIGQVRAAIGLAMATEEFGGRFFGQGAMPGLVLKHPQVLSDPAKENIRKSWNERHQGLERSHLLAILEEGLSVEKIGIPPAEAQFLELREFQDRQIAKLFRIPLHMLADMQKGAGFSSVEHLGQEFIAFSLMPWLVRWEQEVKRSLFLPSERSRWFAEHMVQGLARGDLKTRYQAYAIGRQWGWLSVNRILELENMNPIGAKGDMHLVPMNMVPADQAGKLTRAQRKRLIRQLRMLEVLDLRHEAGTEASE